MASCKPNVGTIVQKQISLMSRPARGLSMSHTVADRAHGPHIHHPQAWQLKTRPTPALIMGTTSMIDRRRIAHAAYEAQAAGLHQTRTGRRTRLKIERHTQGYPLSVPFNRHLMGRSQSAVDGAGGSQSAFFILWSRKCPRYVCN